MDATQVFNSIKDIRSDSDNGFYLSAVEAAVYDGTKFQQFKRDPHYNVILEHASFEQGLSCLNIVKERNDGLLDRALKGVLLTDELGGPVKHKFDGVNVPLSTTTLRYLKVASDLNRLFGKRFNSVAEIGCGYGGQALVNDQLLEVSRAHLFDLPIVNSLIKKYLESFLMEGSFETKTINTSEPRPYDLVISNYAFSELPRVVQEKYIDKVLSHSKRGFLTMNSGNGGEFDVSSVKYSLAGLEKVLPPFEVMEERPLTSGFNYIIVWGHEPGVKLYD